MTLKYELSERIRWGRTEQYYDIDVDYTLEGLNDIRVALENPENEGNDLLLSELEDYAADIADELEVEFIYKRLNGKQRKYTPAAYWEASSSCEWEQSAERGVTHGWDFW